uniref:Secreted protein n=1 Tax=Parascaris univalens TaxID=6257 RepID=A0A914ZM65_PARUN
MNSFRRYSHSFFCSYSPPLFYFCGCFCFPAYVKLHLMLGLLLSSMTFTAERIETQKAAMPGLLSHGSLTAHNSQKKCSISKIVVWWLVSLFVDRKHKYLYSKVQHRHVKLLKFCSSIQADLIQMTQAQSPNITSLSMHPLIGTGLIWHFTAEGIKH